MSGQLQPRPARTRWAQGQPGAGRATAGDWRTSDFLLFAMLPFAVIPVAGFPLAELAMAAAVLLAVTRAPDPATRIPVWLGVLLTSLCLWMCVVSLLIGIAPYRRLIHLALFCVLLVFLARGKFAIRSVATGLAVGLVTSATAGVFGLGRVGYEGRLTGFLGDPNVAGFYLVTLGAVSAAHLPNVRVRRGLLVVLPVLVLLTLSRTSMLAMALAAVWVLARRKLPLAPNLALAGLLMYSASAAADRLNSIGPFAERAGSDLLRDRIVDLERLQIAQHPWIGNGPGTSTINLGDNVFFFHNSYLALQNEGGLVAVAIFSAMGAFTLFSLARRERGADNLWLEAALVAVATCAVNLGEVLLELPTAVVIGTAIRHITRGRTTEPSATDGAKASSE
jgi:hypothetical protein